MPASRSVEGGLHSGELRREQRAVVVHMAHQPGLVFQETHVAKLVQLVGPDGALEQARQIPGHVGGRRPEERQTRPGECDLRRRGKDEGAIRVPGLRAGVEDVSDLMPAFGQMVDRVSIVPEQAKVGRSGAHRGEAADGFR